MSYVRIWVHLVFATKNREPLLKKDFRYDLYNHIAENCREKDIFLKEINGYTEHIHGLISLGKDQSIAKVSQLIKGESSFWINQNNFTTINLAGKTIILLFQSVNRRCPLLETILKIKKSIILRNHSTERLMSL